MKTIRNRNPFIALVAAILITSSVQADVFDDIKDQTSGLVASIKDRTSDLADGIKDKAGDLVDGVKHVVDSITQPEPPPIITSVTDSRFGKGKVLTLINNRHEKLYFVVKTQCGEDTDHFLVDIKPGKKANIGWLQGMIFKTGDRVEITSDQFETINLTIQ